MRLSDGIAMGRVLINFEPYEFLDSSCTRGCAIGMGLAAVDGKWSGNNLKRMYELWPWLKNICPQNLRLTEIDCMDWEYKDDIGSRAFEIQQGVYTLDQLIDWVRSVEPAEQEEVVDQETQLEFASVT